MIITDKNIGLEIKRICGEKKITLKKLSELTGIRQAQISMWIKEEPNTIVKLRHILKTLETL